MLFGSHGILFLEQFNRIQTGSRGNYLLRKWSQVERV